MYRLLPILPTRRGLHSKAQQGYAIRGGIVRVHVIDLHLDANNTEVNSSTAAISAPALLCCRISRCHMDFYTIFNLIKLIYSMAVLM